MLKSAVGCVLSRLSASTYPQSYASAFRLPAAAAFLSILPAFLISFLHRQFLSDIAHLYAMNERGSPTNGAGHMHRFRHFLDVRSLFERRLRVRIDAVWTLHGVSDGQSDEGLLALRQHALGKHRAVVVHEFIP